MESMKKKNKCGRGVTVKWVFFTWCWKLMCTHIPRRRHRKKIDLKRNRWTLRIMHNKTQLSEEKEKKRRIKIKKITKYFEHKKEEGREILRIRRERQSSADFFFLEFKMNYRPMNECHIHPVNGMYAMVTYWLIVHFEPERRNSFLLMRRTFFSFFFVRLPKIFWFSVSSLSSLMIIEFYSALFSKLIYFSVIALAHNTYCELPNLFDFRKPFFGRQHNYRCRQILIVSCSYIILISSERNVSTQVKKINCNY